MRMRFARRERIIVSTPTKPKKIRALIGIEKMPDDKVSTLLTNSCQGLTINAATFPKLPIGVPTYKGAIDDFNAARPAADDGSRTAITHKNKLKAIAVHMYVELAHHVESNCDNDMTTFL